MNHLMKQIFRFGIVGGTAFLIDYGLLIFFTESVGLNYLLSSAISFSVSVIYNYILSIYWVFDVSAKKSQPYTTFSIFITLSLIGLVLNQFLMWLGSDILGIYYLITKIFATAIVMVYNFITRKLFLEKGEISR